MQFIKSNLVYVLWFVLYFSIVWALLGADGQAFMRTFLIYGISISVVLLNIINYLFKYVFEMSLIGFLYFGQIILSLNSRSNEFQADNFAYNISYGEELISALYLLQKISVSRKMTLKERMTSSHPHIAKRIERLENMEENMNVFA